MCVITHLGCDNDVVAEPGDLRFRVGLSVTVKVTWFTFLQLAVQRLCYPHRRSYGHTQNTLYQTFYTYAYSINIIVLQLHGGPLKANTER